MACIVDASDIDVCGISKSKSDNDFFSPGNMEFDPLGIYPKTEEGQRRMQLAKIKNGRFTMISIAGFAIQKFVFKSRVINQLPLFF